MAATEGRVAKPERWWDCCCGTPNFSTMIVNAIITKTSISISNYNTTAFNPELQHLEW